MLLQTPPNSGLTEGDLIYSINGTSMASLPYNKICEEFGINNGSDDAYMIKDCQVVGLVNRWSTIAPKTREASES